LSHALVLVAHTRAMTSKQCVALSISPYTTTRTQHFIQHAPDLEMQQTAPRMSEEDLEKQAEVTNTSLSHELKDPCSHTVENLEGFLQ
jgi:hypothetical protein